MLRPFEEGLVLEQLRYADEIRAFSEVPVGEAEVKPAELDLALKLIEQISEESFLPERYEDEQRKRTWELIQKKVEGEEIVAAPEEAPKAQIIDLMAALKASLGDADEDMKPARRAVRKPAAKKRAARK
jgi:DNA end-binding protein Ku